MIGSSATYFSFQQPFHRFVYYALMYYGFALSLAVPSGMTDRYDVQDAFAEIDADN